MMDWMLAAKWNLQNKLYGLRKKMFGTRSEGIDGILVTVGLCIIALLLCVVMRTQLSEFIETLVSDMTTKAQGILSGK